MKQSSRSDSAIRVFVDPEPAWRVTRTRESISEARPFCTPRSKARIGDSAAARGGGHGDGRSDAARSSKPCRLSRRPLPPETGITGLRRDRLPLRNMNRKLREPRPSPWRCSPRCRCTNVRGSPRSCSCPPDHDGPRIRWRLVDGFRPLSKRDSYCRSGVPSGLSDDAIFLSHSLIRARPSSLHRHYQTLESSGATTIGQRFLTTFLLFVTSVATATHISIILYVADFTLLCYRQLSISRTSGHARI